MGKVTQADFDRMETLIREFLVTPLSNEALRNQFKGKSKKWLRYFGNFALCYFRDILDGKIKLDPVYEPDRPHLSGRRERLNSPTPKNDKKQPTNQECE